MACVSLSQKFKEVVAPEPQACLGMTAVLRASSAFSLILLLLESSGGQTGWAPSHPPSPRPALQLQKANGKAGSADVRSERKEEGLIT